MLPISRHRTLVIPHRLALAAAGVCLALSFTVDQTAIDEKLQAEHNTPVEQIEPTASAPVNVSPPDQAGDSGSSGNVSLLPWFSGLTH